MKKWGRINDKMPLEEQSAKAREGFDTRVNGLPGWIKMALILLAIIGAGLIIYGIMNNSSGGGIGGGQRNCILSVMGNPPDCSDNDGVAKATYANGKYKGICSGLSNSGACIE
jgi:hypothetical protein